MPIYRLRKPTHKGKRFMILTPENKKINFGSLTGETFIDHKDEKKKQNWINRHSKLNENWEKSGVNTAGFWSRHLLWSAPNLKDAVKYIKERFGIEVVSNFL